MTKGDEARRGYVGPTYKLESGETIYCLKARQRIEITNAGNTSAQIRFIIKGLFKVLSEEASLVVSATKLTKYYEGTVADE